MSLLDFFWPQVLVGLLANLVSSGKKPVKVVEEEEEEEVEEEDDKPVKSKITISQNCNDYPQF